MNSNANTDRFLIAVGGFVGFGGPFLMAVRGGDDISGALLRASVGMIVGALLMKIFIYVAHAAVRESMREKMQEKVAAIARQAEQAPAEEDAPKTQAHTRPARPARRMRQ